MDVVALGKVGVIVPADAVRERSQIQMPSLYNLTLQPHCTVCVVLQRPCVTAARFECPACILLLYTHCIVPRYSGCDSADAVRESLGL